MFFDSWAAVHRTVIALLDLTKIDIIQPETGYGQAFVRLVSHIMQLNCRITDMSVQQGRAINFLKGLHVKLGMLWRAAPIS